MTDQSKKLSYENAGYISGKMVNDLSPRKTMLVLVIVVGCFAVLWPKVFYPMLVGSANNRIKPSSIDRTQGCCDVIYEKDVTTIKLMSEICNTIIKNNEENPLSNKELIQKCQNIVLDTCGIDISAVLQEQVRLGHTTKQILEEIRSLNGSLCLKYNFGVAPWKLGVPHRITVKMSPSSSIRQERPIHLRSEMIHPAFRERGRAIPQPEFAPTKPAPPSHLIKKVVEGRPGPIPGMRPTIGGAGHVVPPTKQGGNSMGLIMPLYTIGIVIFFAYTVMKIVFKKQSDVLYQPITPDPHFRRQVFEADRGHLGSKVPKEAASSKLVVNAMSALLDEVDLELSSRRKAGEVIQEDVVANGSLASQEDDQSSVQVLGMETTASQENGQKWTSSSSPLLPVAHPHPPDTPLQEIFLEGSLPPQSHLLVTDSATEAQKLDAEQDPAVVLAGKMTLSVISLDSSENGTEDLGKKEEEISSSNVSEEFEKIDIAQLEEEINDIIVEAEHVTLEDCKNNETLSSNEFDSCTTEVNADSGQKTQNLIDITEQPNIFRPHKELIASTLDEHKQEEPFTIKNEIETDTIEKENSVSVENLIEESVEAVMGKIQDKQKELDNLLLKTEQDLVKTAEFIDSKVDKIQKDLTDIEDKQNVQQELNVRTQVVEKSLENVKEDLLSAADAAADEVVNVEETLNINEIEKYQIEKINACTDKIELPTDIKELAGKATGAAISEINEEQRIETDESFKSKPIEEIAQEVNARAEETKQSIANIKDREQIETRDTEIGSKQVEEGEVEIEEGHEIEESVETALKENVDETIAKETAEILEQCPSILDVTPQPNEIKEAIDTIKEVIVIEELIIPSSQKELNTQELVATETKIVAGEIPQVKHTVQDVKIEDKQVLGTPIEAEKDRCFDNEDSITIEKTPSQDLIQKGKSFIEEKDEKTDTTKNIETVIDSGVDEVLEVEEECLLESDNEQVDDVVDLEEIVDSEITEAVLLADKKEDVVEEEYEEGSEDEYEEEVEIDEESEEEIEHEIVEYVSDEEEEIEVEDEEDLDEIEDSKVISHV